VAQLAILVKNIAEKIPSTFFKKTKQPQTGHGPRNSKKLSIK